MRASTISCCENYHSQHATALQPCGRFIPPWQFFRKVLLVSTYLIQLLRNPTFEHLLPFQKNITFQLFSNLELLYVLISALSENKMRSYYAYNFQIDFSVLLYNYFQLANLDVENSNGLLGLAFFFVVQFAFVHVISQIQCTKIWKKSISKLGGYLEYLPFLRTIISQANKCKTWESCRSCQRWKFLA